MSKSKIEWTDRTWNPVTGCTPNSPGCKNCYAATMASRLKAMGLIKYKNGFKVTCHPESLNEPLKWKKPSKIFVCSMGDLFHEDVPFEFIEKVYHTMSLASHHTFQVLTKRPERMRGFLEYLESKGWLPDRNIWHGVTAENQEQADKRIPLLLQIPAAKRFVSIEPCLSSVDLLEYLKLNKGDIQNDRSRNEISSVGGGRCVFCRQKGESLEAQGDGGGQSLGHSSDRKNLKETTQGGDQQSRLSNGNVYTERQEDEDLRPPHSLDGTQSTNYSKRHGNKSQKREQGRSPSVKLRGSDKKPEYDTQLQGIDQEEETATRGNERKCQVDQRASNENSATMQRETNSSIENCGNVRNSPSDGICYSCRQKLESHSVGISWVILGGESGQGARPMHPDWARSLRDQCKAAGVPFFFKQWGEWEAEDLSGDSFDLSTLASNQCVSKGVRDHTITRYTRIGKAKAGSLLDGKEYKEFPGEGGE